MPEPWQIGNVPGPKQANTITDPAIVTAMVGKAKRPLLIVGHEVIGVKIDDTTLTGMLTEAAKKGAQIIATAHTMREFAVSELKSVSWMGVVEITDRLADQEWMGVDEKGQHDLVLFLGIPYYLESQMLSTLKHFAPQLKTISLDRYYQPNADWSFSNIKEDEWRKHITVITKNLGGKA